MTIERIMHEVTFRCDGIGCDEFIDTGTDDFAEANRMREQEQWLARKTDQGGWEHFCLGCNPLGKRR